MPAKSKQQLKFFEMCANNPDHARLHCMSQETAKEYVKMNKGSMAYKKLPDRVFPNPKKNK
jgi:hypothetical protein